MGIWISGSKALVLATNLNTVVASSTSPLLFGEAIKQRIPWLLREGVSLDSASSVLTFEPLGSAILILPHSKGDLEMIFEHDEL